MKRIILLSSIVLLLTNFIFWVILSYYEDYNAVASSIVIVTTGSLLYVTDIINLKNGYRISFLLLFSIIGIIEFVLSLVAPNRFEDNWWLIIIVCLMSFEIILLIVTNTISSKIK